MNDSLEVITDSVMRGVINNNAVVTGFPYLKGLSYEQFELTSIAEWSHAENLEAVVRASHASGCGISFFATDYAIHKHIYKSQKELSINVIGLVYKLREFVVAEANSSGKITFSDDFCAYFPVSEDEIEFIGLVQSKVAYSLGEVAGYLIKVGITPDFSMEFFIAQTNLSIELEENKHVTGIAWIQGTIEK